MALAADSHEFLDTHNLFILASAACIELENRRRLSSKTKKKRTALMAAATAVIAKPEPPLKKLSFELEKQQRSSSKTKNKGTASVANATAVTNFAGPEPPLKKLKSEFAEPIFSSVGADLKSLTLIKKEKKIVRDFNPIAKPGPPPLKEAPANLKQKIAEMDGTEPILVSEKPLTDSDLKRNLGRLQIPESQMNKFLSDGESGYLMTKEGTKLNGIATSLHQYSGDGEYRGFSGVMVKRWPMKKPNGSPPAIMTVLTTGWNDVVTRNKLNAGEMVQVWAFRVLEKLHLALMLV